MIGEIIVKHRKGIIITTIITIIICFVAVPLGVNYAFRHVAPVRYIGCALGGI